MTQIRIEEKVTIWNVYHLKVDEQELEQVKKVIQSGENWSSIVEPIYSETLHNTEQVLTPQENGGFATVELYDDESDVLITSNQ